MGRGSIHDNKGLAFRSLNFLICKVGIIVAVPSRLLSGFNEIMSGKHFAQCLHVVVLISDRCYYYYYFMQGEELFTINQSIPPEFWGLSLVAQWPAGEVASRLCFLWD